MRMRVGWVGEMVWGESEGGDEVEGEGTALRAGGALTLTEPVLLLTFPGLSHRLERPRPRLRVWWAAVGVGGGLPHRHARRAEWR